MALLAHHILDVSLEDVPSSESTSNPDALLPALVFAALTFPELLGSSIFLEGIVAVV